VRLMVSDVCWSVLASQRVPPLRPPLLLLRPASYEVLSTATSAISGARPAASSRPDAAIGTCPNTEASIKSRGRSLLRNELNASTHRLVIGLKCTTARNSNDVYLLYCCVMSAYIHYIVDATFTQIYIQHDVSFVLMHHLCTQN